MDKAKEMSAAAQSETKTAAAAAGAVAAERPPSVRTIHETINERARAAEKEKRAGFERYAANSKITEAVAEETAAIERRKRSQGFFSRLLPSKKWRSEQADRSMRAEMLQTVADGNRDKLKGLIDRCGSQSDGLAVLTAVRGKCDPKWHALARDLDEAIENWRSRRSHNNRSVEATLKAAGFKPVYDFSSSVDSTATQVARAYATRENCIENGTFETGEKDPEKILCSDDDCPCTDCRLLVVGKTAYLYISPQVVELRKEHRTLIELAAFLQEQKKGTSFEKTLMLYCHVLNPFYLCETGAKRRNLELKTALADAKMVAQTGFAPLRPTPTA